MKARLKGSRAAKRKLLDLLNHPYRDEERPARWREIDALLEAFHGPGWLAEQECMEYMKQWREVMAHFEAHKSRLLERAQHLSPEESAAVEAHLLLHLDPFHAEDRERLGDQWTAFTIAALEEDFLLEVSNQDGEEVRRQAAIWMQHVPLTAVVADLEERVNAPMVFQLLPPSRWRKPKPSCRKVLP